MIDTAVAPAGEQMLDFHRVPDERAGNLAGLR
jgi:hypothetical protein